MFSEETAPKNDNSDNMLLDMCSLRAEPVLNFYVEHIDLPKDVIKQFNMKLEGIETAAGLVILSKLPPFTRSCTVKILKFGTPQTIAIIVLKIEKFDVTLHYCIQKMLMEW